jgi:dipeptidyl aminopeptidase/acylaminoacyl peptidase
MVDVASGKVRLIVRGQRIAQFKLSPNGSRIAYTTPKRFEKPGSQSTLFDLITLTLASDEEQVVASDVPLAIGGDLFSWSPDSLQLSYRRLGEEKPYDCYVVDVSGGRPRNVTTLPSSQENIYQSATPLWGAKGEHIYFVRNGGLWRASVAQAKALELARIPNHRIEQMISQSGGLLWTPDRWKSTIVLASDNFGKQDAFYKIDLTNGESRRLLEQGECYTCVRQDEDEFVAVTGDGQHLVYFAEDAQHCSNLWMNDPSFRSPRRLTDINPQFEKYKLGTARLIDWLSLDGERLRGALLLPSDYKDGARVPLVVLVYGGESLSNHFDNFGLGYPGPFNMQLLATRGYAVLLPDSPQNPGTPMLDLAKTVIPGVNKIIEMGIVDSDRVGVMGHSNGGYSTLALIVQTKRFKAAVEAGGMGDLVGDYGEMDKAGAAFGTSSLEHGQDALGGTPWQFRERYIENSPIFYLDRMETPLLIVHGSADRTVASFLGDEVFVGLRRLGKEVEYAKYEGEEHSPLGWSYANQVDFCSRMIAWFDKYLKGPNLKQDTP